MRDFQSIVCQKCDSEEITEETFSEYTGGGYRDYWIEYVCQKCGNIWRSEVKTGYM